MRQFMLGISFAMAATVGLWGQEAAAQRFEVASLKAVSLESGKPVQFIGIQGGPGSSDPGRLVASYAPLRQFLQQAFKLRQFQVIGPSWLDSERVDMVAKIPAGATPEQVRVMMRNLLIDRFKLESHPDRRDLPVYALTARKDELKLKPSGSIPDGKPADGPQPENGPKIGADGFPVLPASALTGGPIILYRNGKARLQMRKMPLQKLVDMLNGQLDRLVIDETGLTDEFDIDLYWTPDPASLQLRPGPPEVGKAGEAAEPSSPLISAIREQLGIRVVPKKGPVDVLVVDHIEKTPTEN